MKKHLLLLALFTLPCLLFTARAQLLCVQCFSQNDSIGVGVGSANMIINGGFETTTCVPNSGQIGSLTSFCPNSAGYACDFANWTCTGGGTNTYSCLYSSSQTHIIQGNNGVYFGNHFCNACSVTVDDTSCLVNSNCMVSGIPAGYPVGEALYGNTTGISLSQSVSGLVPGNIYVLEFWAGGEGSSSSYDKPGLFAIDIGFGNTFLRNRNSPVGNGVGSRFLVQFKATSATHTIKFTNWGHISNYSTELVLDDVRLYIPQYLPPSVTLCTVGINKTTDNAVSIYPNPATNELTVNTGNTAPSVITIYDMLSQKLIQQSFTSEIKLNIQALAKGIYMYEVSNGKEVVKGKVIKE